MGKLGLFVSSVLVIAFCLISRPTDHSDNFRPQSNSRRLLQENGKLINAQTRLAIINHLPNRQKAEISSTLSTDFDKSGIPEALSPDSLAKHIAAVNHMPIESVENALSSRPANRPEESRIFPSSSNDVEAMPPGISSVKYLTVSRLSGPVSDPPEVIDGQQSDWWW